MVESFDGRTPRIHERAWVHESAVVIGEVELAEGVSVWPTAVLRGDMGPIRVGRDSNIQDGAICHDTTDFSETVIGERVTVGHRAILHGCRIGNDCLVGMGAIVLDRADIGDGSLVAAGSVVTPGKVFPPGSFILGSPARVLRPMTDRDREMIAFGWTSYRDRLRLWLG
ncbi:MAG: gamma carbonic anhydrase family protein [Alphaproteobacteria bacterium]|nr:gamma carbonic anhydrase family protein [Alphaproteobacteria bacterium]MCB9696318.1 gamma carbonic anhydrase family protein [Alphaproteobacteria bacterium]